MKNLNAFALKLLYIVISALMFIGTACVRIVPEPVPKEKLIFVGTWNSMSGFELTINRDGTASILQDIDDRGSAYENLNIKVGPSRITKLLVSFREDTGITVNRPGYYAREYRIDSAPFADSNNIQMVLNGILLVKEKIRD
jgi:hypothetical protein